MKVASHLSAKRLNLLYQLLHRLTPIYTVPDRAPLVGTVMNIEGKVSSVQICRKQERRESASHATRACYSTKYNDSEPHKSPGKVGVQGLLRNTAH